MHLTNTTNIDVIRFLRGRLSSNDNKAEATTPFSDRLVYEALRSSRASLIFQKQQANQYLNQDNYQTIGCIPLREVDVVDCPCAPKSGCTFRASTIDVPTPIGKFYSVTSIDGSITYAYVPWDRFKYKLNDRYASTSSTAFFTTKNTKKGARLYLYNDIHKEYAAVTGIFADPVKVYGYPKCDAKPLKCTDPLYFNFPIDPELLPNVYEMAVQLLRPLSPQADKLQNDSDDSHSNTPLK